MPSPRVLMIADLHLSERYPETLRLFESFIEREASHATALYILGDFFESWIGDDDNTPVAQRVSQTLRGLHQKGVALYFMPGNRDFLLQQHYCQSCNMMLLPDPYPVNILGHEVVLSHGDALCTDDKAYQRFRRVVRNPAVQFLFKHLPLSWRRKIAQNLRQHSHQTQMKKGQWCEVNQQAVLELMNLYPTAVQLIHGHTHEFKVHAEQAGIRYVLGDWHPDGGSYIEITPQEVVLKKFPSSL